jgi:hypothetical protein
MINSFLLYQKPETRNQKPETRNQKPEPRSLAVYLSFATIVDIKYQ